MDNLHQNSRNAKRLHKAQVRDDRLEKLAQARKKGDQPLRMLFTCPQLSPKKRKQG